MKESAPPYSSTFYNPWIDSSKKIMTSAKFSVIIEEPPLADLEEPKTIKEMLLQFIHKQRFVLRIRAEQPISNLRKIRKDYAKISGGKHVIAQYKQLKGVDSLKHVKGEDFTKFQSEYELSKPYYERKGNGLPVRICAESITFCATSMIQILFKKAEENLQKEITALVTFPLIPKEKVIAPVIKIERDSPDSKGMDAHGYNRWWSCSNENKGRMCNYKLTTAYAAITTNDAS